MILYHTTPARNLRLILCHGLNPACSLNQEKASVWLCTAAKVPWAIRHAVIRHRTPAAEVIVLAVRVPRGWLRKAGKPGRYHSGGRVVPSSRIVGVQLASQIQKETSHGGSKGRDERHGGR